MTDQKKEITPQDFLNDSIGSFKFHNVTKENQSHIIGELMDIRKCMRILNSMNKIKVVSSDQQIHLSLERLISRINNLVNVLVESI